MPDQVNAKEAYVAARIGIVTEMSHGQIVASKTFTAGVRASCFYSAKVAEVRVLERLRKVSDEFTLGRMNLAQARGELKTFLRSRGYQPDGAVTDGKDTDRGMGNLASTARLNLILNQNKLMADAVGKRSEILRLGVPFQRYVPSWKRDKRDSHKRYYDMVLPATDPFWSTHTPPLEFNCGCSIEPVWDADEAGEYGGVATASQAEDGTWSVTAPDGTQIPVPPSESGYQFDSGAAFQTADLGRLHEPYREQVVQDMTDLVKETRQTMSFLAAPTDGELSQLPLSGLDGLDTALKPGVSEVRTMAAKAGLDPDAMPPYKEVNTAFKAAGLGENTPPQALLAAVPSAGQSLGTIDAPRLRRLGLPGESLDLRLSQGSRLYGIRHCWRHHKEVFCDPAETAALLAASFGRADSVLSLSILPGKGTEPPMHVIGCYGRSDKAFAAALVSRDGKAAELVSWHRAEEAYSDSQALLRGIRDVEDAAGEGDEQ